MKLSTAAMTVGVALGILLAGTVPARTAGYSMDEWDKVMTLGEHSREPLEELLRAPPSRVEIRCEPSGRAGRRSPFDMDTFGLPRVSVMVLQEAVATAIRDKLLLLGEDHPLHESATQFIEVLEPPLQSCRLRRIFRS